MEKKYQVELTKKQITIIKAALFMAEWESEETEKKAIDLIGLLRNSTKQEKEGR